jgi:putative membrane protein
MIWHDYLILASMKNHFFYFVILSQFIGLGFMADHMSKGSNREDVREFLTDMADARMMDSREGEEAIKNATSEDIRDYGSLMVKDQALLLMKIRQLASERKIVLPASISKDKQEGLKDLMSLKGKDFDEKFLKMITLDHKRDIKQFEKASKFDDREISSFATANLPVIESHLARVKAIKEHH